MKRLILLMITIIVLVSSCTKNDDLIVKDKEKEVLPKDLIERKYEVSRIDSVSTYIVTCKEFADTKVYRYKVGDTVDINIYLNEIRSESQYTRKAIVTNKL